MAGFSWGGMAAAIPMGYLEAQKQQQQMADEMMRRKLMQQQFATTQRQAPLQDQLLRAQVQRELRPDINAQRFAQENQAAQYGLGFIGTPGAQPMPQPPQGGVPQAFQGAQPMPGVSAGQPQGQPGMQPNPFAQAPQGQPPAPQGMPQGQPPAPQGMPQGQPQAMYQPPAPAAMQPQGQPQGMPQGQPQATDPLAAQEQQAMNALRQRVQQELPSIPPQQRAAYAMAVQQAQQQIQLQANEARKMAMEQLNQRKQQELENWREKQAQHWENAQGGQASRAERSSLTSQRDTDMRGLDQARASGMIPDEVYQAGKVQIEQKYSAIAPGKPNNADNFTAANQSMRLTPQEQALYKRHLTNLTGPGGVNNPDGSRSTLFQASVEGPGGKTYNIPTVWDGKILPIGEAIKRVASEGWNKFPSYATEEEAESRYQQMHDYMEKDTAKWLSSQGAMKTPGAAISDKVYNRLVDAAKTQFGEEADPAKVVGKTIQDTDGKQYKIVEHEGKLDFEPVK